MTRRNPMSKNTWITERVGRAQCPCPSHFTTTYLRMNPVEAGEEAMISLEVVDDRHTTATIQTDLPISILSHVLASRGYEIVKKA